MNQEAVDKLFDRAKRTLAYAVEATPNDHDQALQESMACSLLLIADALQNQIIYMRDSDRV